jgi:hypothetical protein
MTVIDFDDEEFYERFLEKAEDLIKDLPIQRSGKGFHIGFRSGKSFGSRKLAWKVSSGKKQIAIETKAEGGYIIVAPSLHGTTGNRYEAIRGSFAELPKIPDERASKLIQLAQNLDQTAIELDFSAQTVMKLGSKNQAIIDEFNRNHSVEELLTKHGYKRYADGKYLAPNSTSGNPGILISDRNGKQVCFSFHADQLGEDLKPESGTPLPHDAFDVFRILEHGGDFQAALHAADVNEGTSEKLMPKFINCDLMQTDLPQPQFIVPRFIPEGLTILAGKPKIGKSWLALELCVEVARGGTVLGEQAVEGQAVYFALEDNPKRLKARLHLLLPDETRTPERLILAGSDGLQHLDNGGVEQLQNFLQANPSVKLIVIDTFVRVKPKQTKQNIYDEEAGIMDVFHKLAIKHEIALVVIHHTRKMEAEDTFDMISGSFGLQGIADAMITLTRKRGQSEATISVTGRDLEEELELAIKHDKDTHRWCVLGNAAEVQMRKERSDIIQVLRAAESPLKPSEIASRLDRNRGAVKALMHKMASDDQLISNGDGSYKVAEL